MKRALILGILSLLMAGSFLARGAAAQSAAVFAPVPPLIDGALEDSWEEAVKFISFSQILPAIGDRSTLPTVTYFLYDRENIYLAGRVQQPPGSILASRAKRDSSLIWEGDYMLIALDPVLNANNAYFFIINPANAVMDGTFDDLAEFNTEWDALFDSAAKVSPESWSFEVRIPLSSIPFQSRDVQDWGIMFSHSYAGGREKTINQLLDRHQPYRILAFHRIRGLTGLKPRTRLDVTPYVFGAGDAENGWPNGSLGGKTGVDMRFRPGASTSVSLSLHPDYAQLETDREVINVTDLPTSYPEKRPFFTDSSDMYPGLAVNTRNITDIRLGMKFRRVAHDLKIDLTGVVDDLRQRWLLGNVRWTDNRSYHFEIISGLRSQPTRTDYNVTTHLRTWFYDKRLTLYTWFGTINQPDGRSNDFESVNSVKWNSRAVSAGLWNQIKTRRYNPGIVGFPVLSNEIILQAWSSYSWIRPKGLLRLLKVGCDARTFALYSSPRHAYVDVNLSLETTLNLGRRWGDWKWMIEFFPKTNQKFRYRDVARYEPRSIFEDAIGKFVLIGQPQRSVTIRLLSDPSRPVAFSFQFANAPVRQSPARNLKSEVFWKAGSRALASYALDDIDISGSPYQAKYRQTIHRFQAEYNLTENLNIRVIIQSNCARVLHDLPGDIGAATNSITLSWQLAPGSFLYFVYGRQAGDMIGTPMVSSVLGNRQCVLLKFNRTFSF